MQIVINLISIISCCCKKTSFVSSFQKCFIKLKKKMTIIESFNIRIEGCKKSQKSFTTLIKVNLQNNSGINLKGIVPRAFVALQQIPSYFFHKILIQNTSGLCFSNFIDSLIFSPFFLNANQSI